MEKATINLKKTKWLYFFYQKSGKNLIARIRTNDLGSGNKTKRFFLKSSVKGSVNYLY